MESTAGADSPAPDTSRGDPVVVRSGPEGHSGGCTGTWAAGTAPLEADRASDVAASLAALVGRIASSAGDAWASRFALEVQGGKEKPSGEVVLLLVAALALQRPPGLLRPWHSAGPAVVRAADGSTSAVAAGAFPPPPGAEYACPWPVAVAAGSIR
jgi:hypothetical protein